MDLNGILLCAAGAAYNIIGTTYSPQNDHLYEPQLKWTVEPVAFTGGIADIDACFVGQNAEGIIVSARGTLFSGNNYIDDWLSDFCCDPVNWSYPFAGNAPTALPGMVHSGFYSAVQSVYAGVQSTVQALRAASSPPAPVYVTGHSKGGGMAPLIAYLLQYNGIPVEQIVTFAAPKSGNTAFAAAYTAAFPNGSAPKHIRYENYGDLVPFFWPLAGNVNPAIQKLVAYLDTLPEPGPTLASDIALAEKWDYQTVGAEYYINWLPLIGQSIVTDQSTIDNLQDADFTLNLVGQVAEGHSLETILYVAHTIGCCISGSTTPVVGYLSAVCPNLCPANCPSS